jgi:hypothetical protein
MMQIVFPVIALYAAIGAVVALPTNDFELAQRDWVAPTNDFELAQRDWVAPTNDFELAERDWMVPTNDFELVQQDWGLPNNDFELAPRDMMIGGCNITGICQTARRRILPYATNSLCSYSFYIWCAANRIKLLFIR